MRMIVFFKLISSFCVNIAAAWGAVFIVSPYIAHAPIFIEQQIVVRSVVACIINLSIAYYLSIKARNKEEHVDCSQ